MQIAKEVKYLSEGESRSEPLRCAEDLRDGDELKTMVSRLEQLVTDQLAREAFPVEMDQEQYVESHDEGDLLDGIEYDDDIGDDMLEILIHERPLLCHCLEGRKAKPRERSNG